MSRFSLASKGGEQVLHGFQGCLLLFLGFLGGFGSLVILVGWFFSYILVIKRQGRSGEEESKRQQAWPGDY